MDFNWEWAREADYYLSPGEGAALGTVNRPLRSFGYNRRPRFIGGTAD
jgi:hypothetical protein